MTAEISESKVAKDKLAKTVAIVFTLLLVANILLLAFGKTTIKEFWMIIIFSAAVAWWGLPKLRE